MMLRQVSLALLSLASAICGSSVTLTGDGPAQDLVAVVSAWVRMPQPGDWESLDRLPGIRWAPLPPASLQNCAPDGGCFARPGQLVIAGRTLALIASGARSMVLHVYLRNGGAPIGEEAVLGALRASAITATLARCPVSGGMGSTNWYRLGGANVSPAFLAIQAATARRTGEGFVISTGAELPKLQPNQLAMYSEQCGPGATQAPVATSLPHEQLARTLVGLLVPANAGAPLDWKALAAAPTGIRWDSAGARRGDLSYRNDRNPYNLTGSVTYGGREFSLLASGTPTQVRIVYVDEQGLHPRGEHLLGVVYQSGIAVQLSRCGPVYTTSTNNWYALTSAGTKPAMLRQSLRYEGTQVQDAYELRLDGSLPVRDARDRDPGVNGCR